MSSRFNSTLHQRDPRSALFENYSGGSPARAASASPARGYGYPGVGAGAENGKAGVNAYGGFRSATPNSRGQYSDAVLNELESQNDEQVEGILGKVKQLKTMTIAIGDEIRESSALAEKMNDSFENTRVRIRGTMNRMLIMSQKTGVSWKVWLLFFAAVFGLFFWVWVR
ncbi:protein transport protein bet1 [Clarireedia jacksonii]